MSAFTRALVVISALAALFLNAFAVRETVPSMPALCALALVSGAIASRRVRGAALGVVLVSVYISPAVFLVIKGHHRQAYSVLWIAALLGIAANRPWMAWRFPRNWQWPLVFWALTVALSWPVVAWRELDFTFPVVWDPRLPVANLRLGAPASVAWTAFVALTHLLGLLWFDWLWRTYPPERRAHFLREVVWPLAGSVLIACLVGLYQGFVDISVLSGHVWPTVRRAAGTLMDANAFGMLAAMWAPAFLLIALRGGALAWIVASSAFALAWVGVWTSGSRTALLAALIGTAVSGLMAARRTARFGMSRRWKVSLALVAASVIVLVASVPSVNETAVGRARHLVPTLSPSSIAHTTRALLWDRDGYGNAARAMIAEHPLVGIGVGTYHSLSYDYAREVAGVIVGPDNAQNWFRHQLAEFGLVGSIGWMAWVLMFAGTVGRLRGGTGEGTALIGPLLGFAVASLLGMPGQHPAVIITFWLFVFWYAIDLGVTSETQPSHSSLASIALLVMPIAYAAANAVPNDLRPPFRAARFGFPYTYGLDMQGPTQAWTRKHAVTVLQAPREWLRLTLWVDHPDADKRAVKVDVWKDHDHLINERVFLGERVTRYVRVGQGKRFVLEAEVDRTFRPSADGISSDRRDLGLAMEWDFVPEGPK